MFKYELIILFGMSNSSFDDFLKDLESSGIPDFLCLLAQILITLLIILNLRQNFHRFPIRQLSPVCTIAALLSFGLVNVINVTARYIEQNNHLYKFSITAPCGQCRIYDNPAMEFLALLYAALREFALVIFALKTLRVGVCFIKTENGELSPWMQTLFSSERRLLAMGAGYSILIGMVNYAQLHIGSESINGQAGQLTFQFFCPKLSGVVDWIATLMRYVLMSLSYSLSIKTYKELDFKRFLFLIFILCNTEIIVRIIMVANKIEDTTYHEFYYHSLILNLLGTVLLYPYSKYDLLVQQPPGTAILQNFNAFINYSPGRDILEFYAKHLDEANQTHKYSKCFESYLQVSHIKKLVTLDNNQLTECYSLISEIVKAEEMEEHTSAIKTKLSDHTLKLDDIKRLEKRLEGFCQNQLFRPWKKTASREYIEEEFKRNMVIDEKMNALDIQIGA